ncbi:hypothetical protein [Magnetofaba australis]|uniref:Uncharacterized protein n=1 Tax=Magnetofaba australis IT-1 TaxID=1434232 RepID=A0A1Y2K3R1_9PROT|nr:hypothetical protein [Magnetofaba australis]OSM03988.1 hypothetical protein MAIT1_03764 [Magnetofaba australis IT-1]
MSQSEMFAAFDHLKALLDKCKQENNPHKQLCHMQALKTFLVAYVIQQNTIAHQMRSGTVVEGELEEEIIAKCADCAGDSQKLAQKLHKLLKQYEDEKGVDSMEFRAKASQLINKFDKNLNKFREVMTRAAA